MLATQIRGRRGCVVLSSLRIVLAHTTWSARNSLSFSATRDFHTETQHWNTLATPLLQRASSNLLSLLNFAMEVCNLFLVD